jgi:SAM-dependent methyltransferase
MTPSELDHIAGLEDGFWWYRGMDRIFSRLLRRHLGQPRRILDAGAGTGRFASQLAEEYRCAVDCLDLERRGLRYAAARGHDRLVQGDLRRMPLRDDAYDAIVSLDALVHLPQGEESAALSEFVRLLRPGGVLALRLAAFQALRSRHSVHVRERQRYRLGPLLEWGRAHGLQTLEATYANTLLLPVAWVKFRVIEPLGKAPPRSGIEPLPALLNRALETVLRCEDRLLAAGLRFPVGQSLIWIARRPA